MTKSEKLKYCEGCEDNFYNGHNPLGIQECWALKSAKLKLRKKVSIHQKPPWNQSAEKFFSCYRQKGYVFVGSQSRY